MVTNGTEASEKGGALGGCTPPSANLITQETREAPEGGTSQEVFIPMPACVFMCSCEVCASWAWDADVAEVSPPSQGCWAVRQATVCWLCLSAAPRLSLDTEETKLA